MSVIPSLIIFNKFLRNFILSVISLEIIPLYLKEWTRFVTWCLLDMTPTPSKLTKEKKKQNCQDIILPS